MRSGLILPAALLLLTGCFYPVQVRSPVRARVVDADSGAPLENVNILRIVCDVHDFPCAGARVDAGRTARDGRIRMQGAREWRWWFPVPGGVPAPNHQLLVWKEGYTPLAFSQYGTLADFERMHDRSRFIKEFSKVPRDWVQMEAGTVLYDAVFSNGEIRLRAAR